MHDLCLIGNGVKRASFSRREALLRYLLSRIKNLILFSFRQPNSSSDNLQAITSGDWDVTKILAYDEKRHKM